MLGTRIVKTMVTIRSTTLVLGLHMDGTNNSTNIIDVTGKNLTLVNNVKLSTLDKKIGSASCLFGVLEAGGNGYISIPYTSAFDPSNVDYTISGWFNHLYMDSYETIFSTVQSDVTPTGIELGVRNDPHRLWFRAFNNIGQTVINIYSGTINTQQWIHFEVSKSGSTWRLFVDGVLAAYADESGTISQGTVVFIGHHVGTTANDWWGYMDEIQVHKGIALHTTNFTPPLTEFSYAGY